MKVLVVLSSLRANDILYTPMWRECNAVLKGLGYLVESLVIEDGSTYITDLDESEYAFCIYPVLRDNGNPSGSDYYQPFELSIPVLIPNVGSSASKHDDRVGVTITPAAAFRRIDYPSVGDIWMNSMVGAVVPAKSAYVTTLGSDALGVSTDIVFWKKIGDPTYPAPVYAMGGWSTTGLHQALPILIQEAINNGDISGSKLPPTKLISMWDIDDIPAANNVQSDSDVQNVIDAQNLYKWPMTWGLKSNITGQSPDPPNDNTWPNIPSSQKAMISANGIEKGGYVAVMSHNHNWHWDGADTDVDTKSLMDSTYRGDVDRIAADGIKIGRDNNYDSWGYIYPPNNRVSEEMFQLGAPQLSFLSSPNNDTYQVGYGWLSIRMFNEGTDAGFGYSKRTRSARFHRGMIFTNGSFRLPNSTTELAADSAQELNDFSNTFSRWFTECMGFNAIHFWHGNNFRTDGSNNAPALKLMQAMGKWADFLTIHRFELPTVFANSILPEEEIMFQIGISSSDYPLATSQTSIALTRADTTIGPSEYLAVGGEKVNKLAFNGDNPSANPRSVEIGLYESDVSWNTFTSPLIPNPVLLHSEVLNMTGGEAQQDYEITGLDVSLTAGKYYMVAIVSTGSSTMNATDANTSDVYHRSNVASGSGVPAVWDDSAGTSINASLLVWAEGFLTTVNPSLSAPYSNLFNSTGDSGTVALGDNLTGETSVFVDGLPKGATYNNNTGLITYDLTHNEQVKVTVSPRNSNGELLPNPFFYWYIGPQARMFNKLEQLGPNGKWYSFKETDLTLAALDDAFFSNQYVASVLSTGDVLTLKGSDGTKIVNVTVVKETRTVTLSAGLTIS